MPVIVHDVRIDPAPRRRFLFPRPHSSRVLRLVGHRPGLYERRIGESDKDSPAVVRHVDPVLRAEEVPARSRELVCAGPDDGEGVSYSRRPPRDVKRKSDMHALFLPYTRLPQRIDDVHPSDPARHPHSPRERFSPRGTRRDGDRRDERAVVDDPHGNVRVRRRPERVTPGDVEILIESRAACGIDEIIPPRRERLYYPRGGIHRGFHRTGADRCSRSGGCAGGGVRLPGLEPDPEASKRWDVPYQESRLSG